MMLYILFLLMHFQFRVQAVGLSCFLIRVETHGQHAQRAASVPQPGEHTHTGWKHNHWTRPQHRQQQQQQRATWIIQSSFRAQSKEEGVRGGGGGGVDGWMFPKSSGEANPSCRTHGKGSGSGSEEPLWVRTRCKVGLTRGLHDEAALLHPVCSPGSTEPRRLLIRPPRHTSDKPAVFKSKQLQVGLCRFSAEWAR